MYSQLMGTLEDAAARETKLCLAEMTELSEPFVAREVARTLPSGNMAEVGKM